MLTDIFARRYENRPLFNTVGHREKALFIQAYRIINEQIFKYYGWDKKVSDTAKAIWTSLHDRLTMELGVKELSSKYYAYQSQYMGKPHTVSGSYEMNTVCENWLTRDYTDDLDADVFVKRRLSFIELAFRERDQQLALINAKLPGELQRASFQDSLPPRAGSASMRIPGKGITNVERLKLENDRINAEFKSSVHELNERFKQAGMPLNYHNGYIQITTDALTQAQVEQPFWQVISDPMWANVSTDMATALDLRDSGQADPVFYAGRALESAIKIISDAKGWTGGKETGASAYLDNLEQKGSFIAPWERKIVQAFFKNVRNDYGHGPGSAPMPTMTDQQTDQSIEFCMSWIKSLVKRM